MSRASAWVVYHGPHPEPSLSLPVLDENLAPSRYLRRAGARFGNRRIAVWCFPREVPRRVPAWLGLMMAAIRRREGPWFEVRLGRGEWPRLAARLRAVRPQRPVPPDILGRRARRRWRAVDRRRPPKASEILRCFDGRVVEAFLAGTVARPYQAFNAGQQGLQVRYDPLDLPADKPR